MKRAALASIAAAAVSAVCGAARAHPGEAAPPLDFSPPAPGTYQLAPIQRAPDGEVVDTTGTFRALREFTQGRITLLGLVYTRCDDPDGCPRATWTFGAVRRLLRAQPSLHGRVRLVTLSFDPVHDDAAAMQRYAAREGAARPGAEWQFLTTRSKRALAPILDGFGQDLSIAADSAAPPGAEELSHTLKVFLIDPAGMVREIYSTPYLMPRMIVNDMRTLDRERLAPTALTRSR